MLLSLWHKNGNRVAFLQADFFFLSDIISEMKNKQSENLITANQPRKVFYKVSPQHKTLPHIVKFSGGRSSGMLLMNLLDNKLLKPDRGDVVVFNNTSAEHPATYEFVRQCKAYCEKKGVPFFWTEFQTYETASGGEYARLPSYRLVNERPHSAENPAGYHWRGEVFEELISWTGYLPNQFSGRICTSWMKLFVSKEFLSDWFALKSGIARLGHYGDKSRICPDDVYAAHVRNGGGTPREIFVAKKEFVWSRPIFRAEAKYADFSPAADIAGIRSKELEGKALGGRVRFGGDFAADYCSFVGFRGDEPGRLAKMRARLGGEAAEDDSDSYLAAPEGEHVYAPLMQFGKTKEDVLRFWKRQDWNLSLPSDANRSNCVYCFLKGGNALWQLAHRQESSNRNLPAALRGRRGTPSDIAWWAQLEATYGRDLRAEKRKISSKILAAEEKPLVGFFGAGGKASYRSIIAMSEQFKKRRLRGERRKMMLSEFQNLPCDCTD